jgi:class 3 adenylate cyclase
VATIADGLSIRYATRLATAHLLSVGTAFVLAVPLGGLTLTGPREYFTEKNFLAAAVIVVLGTTAVGAGAVVNIASVVRWFVPGQEPDDSQRRSAMRLVGRQSAILAMTWAVSGLVFILVNLDAGAAVAVPTLLGVSLGGAASVCTGLLLTRDALAPVLAATARGSEGWVRAPSVLARLVSLWILVSALPCLLIVALILIRANGWIIEKNASIELPVMVVATAAVLVGLPLMILTSQSISGPVGEVVEAMAEVEQGRFDTAVGVYEHSEIGRLQSGFNRMVTGLAERERLHDLFGRYVGEDVARRALDEGESMSGDVRDAAVLYIDLVGSTQFAAHRPPQQVAGVLNDFFRIVVNAVDAKDGLINKFEGDAALAIFGAPLRVEDAAAAALATARDLGEHLQQLPMVDFGVGVSAGQVFAGNIGAENRYEYTVIGDPVNEAARLADIAKSSAKRILASAAAIQRADPAEREKWVPHGSKVLRGRSDVTHMSAPADRESPNQRG